MKFPKIKLSAQSASSFNLSFLLTVALFILFAVEGYLIFSNLYGNLSVDTNVLAPNNVVRVDLKAYQNTIDFLDSLKNYKPQALDLKRDNPFK